MAIEVEGKYQQRCLVGMPAIFDVWSKEYVVASQHLTSHTQQLIETSAILFDHPWHFLTFFCVTFINFWFSQNFHRFC